MSHIEKYADVPHGWWHHRQSAPDLPTSIQHRANYVLHMSELQEYADVLKDMKAIIDKQLTEAQHTLKVAEKGHMPFLVNKVPQVFTLCHVLEFELKLGQQRLRLTQQLNVAAAHAVELKRKHDAANAAGDTDCNLSQ